MHTLLQSRALCLLSTYTGAMCYALCRGQLSILPSLAQAALSTLGAHWLGQLWSCTLCIVCIVYHLCFHYAFFPLVMYAMQGSSCLVLQSSAINTWASLAKAGSTLHLHWTVVISTTINMAKQGAQAHCPSAARGLHSCDMNMNDLRNGMS